MPAITTITRSKRLAGIRRFAARPRLGAVGGDAGAPASEVGGMPGNSPRLESGTQRDRGGKGGDARVEAQRAAHIGITSFGADVKIGAQPG